MKKHAHDGPLHSSKPAGIRAGSIPSGHPMAHGVSLQWVCLAKIQVQQDGLTRSHYPARRQHRHVVRGAIRQDGERYRLSCRMYTTERALEKGFIENEFQKQRKENQPGRSYPDGPHTRADFWANPNHVDAPVHFATFDKVNNSRCLRRLGVRRPSGLFLDSTGDRLRLCGGRR